MNEKTKSPYWYWYQFLRRSELYKRCCRNGGRGKLADLYKDFGDVYSQRWETWWRTHQHLFSKEKKYLTERFYSLEELRYYYGEDEEVREEDEEEGDGEEEKKEKEKGQMVLLVNLNESYAALVRDFKEKLKDAGVDKKPGQPLLDTSFYHKYGLTPIPSSRDIIALQNMLDVYDECKRQDAKKSKKSKLTRYQIGHKLFPKKKFLEKESEVLDVKAINNLMTATVSRYLRWARETIQNVEQGYFPKVRSNPAQISRKSKSPG